MKNKKGAKAQKFISQVEKQVKSGGQHPLGQPNAKKEEKEKKLKEQKEMAMLFKPVQTQKLEKGWLIYDFLMFNFDIFILYFEVRVTVSNSDLNYIEI